MLIRGLLLYDVIMMSRMPCLFKRRVNIFGHFARQLIALILTTRLTTTKKRFTETQEN